MNDIIYLFKPSYYWDYSGGCVGIIAFNIEGAIEELKRIYKNSHIELYEFCSRNAYHKMKETTKTGDIWILVCSFELNLRCRHLHPIPHDGNYTNNSEKRARTVFNDLHEG